MASQPLKQENYAPRSLPTQAPIAKPQRRVQADPEAAIRTRERLSILVTLSLMTVFVLFIISRYASIMVNNYNLVSMTSLLNEQTAQNASLQAQVSELDSPTRILHYAESTLKMTPATPVSVGASQR